MKLVINNNLKTNLAAEFPSDFRAGNITIRLDDSLSRGKHSLISCISKAGA